MTWLIPSVIATLLGTLLLVLVYGYFYITDKKAYFATWTLSWGIYFLRYVAMLIYISIWKTPLLLMVNQIVALVSGVLLLAGTHQFLNKRFHVIWWGLTGMGMCWIVYSITSDLPFLVMAFPTFTLMAVVYVWTGITFLKLDTIRGGEKYVVGIAFILWGIHKADYPFLRPVVWFAPWGYLIGAFLGFVVALGIILIYFKKARSELSENQIKFKQLAENIKDVFWVGGPDWKTIDYISPAYETLWGRTCESLYHEPFSWAENLHPEDRDRILNYITEYDIKTGEELTFPEYRIIRPDGELRWVFARAYPIYDETGTVSGITGIASDITKRKHAETSLIRSEDRISTIFQAADNVSFVITDVSLPEPKVVEFSKGAEKIFGYSQREIVGMPVSVLHLSDDVRQFPDVFQKMRTGKHGFRGEATLVRKNGNQFPALFATYPLFDERGKMYAALGVSVDISEQKKMEARLQQAHKLEAVGTLAGGVAHDVNNILGVIIGNTELAMDDIPEDHPATRYLNEVKVASLRATDVVRQLLRFSRKSEPELTPLQLDDVVNETVRLMRATIPKTINVVSSVTALSRQVKADATQIHQVIMNVCTNAAHAMEADGGVLEVRLDETRLNEDTALEMRTLPKGDYALLTISDTGTGIDPDIRSQIFDPYFTTKEVGKGTGMGLAVVHGIVQTHDGAVSIYSEPGIGTTFRIYFPLLDSHRVEPQFTSPLMPMGSETVLVVDDEPALLEMLKHMLTRLGYQVEAMTTPEEALQRFNAAPDRFDLLITDMTMPGMSGDILAKKVLALRPDFPVVLCTGFSERINEDIAGGIGIRKFIEKPIDKLKLATCLREILDTPA